MESKKLNILIVDKHPFVIDLYSDIIDSNNQNGHYEFNFITASNVEEAIQKISIKKAENKKINIAFFDINITPFAQIKSGTDLIILLKEIYPNCKVVIVTDLDEPLKVYNLIQKVNIEVILSKTDMNQRMLSQLCSSVDYKQKYMSESVKIEISKIAKKKMNLDNFDLDIIEKMSQGVKTIDLPKFIPLSLSTIEKRKARLKMEFIDSKASDKILLESIKKLGLF